MDIGIRLRTDRAAPVPLPLNDQPEADATDIAVPSIQPGSGGSIGTVSKGWARGFPMLVA